MTPAHSSGGALRPSGTVLRRATDSASAVSPRSGATASRTVCCIGVSTMPGRIALTRTLRPASACANDRVIPIAAVLVIEYGATSTVPAFLAELEDRLTIAPPDGIDRPIPWHRKNIESTLMAQIRFHSSRPTSQIDLTNRIPAAFTR